MPVIGFPVKWVFDRSSQEIAMKITRIHNYSFQTILCIAQEPHLPTRRGYGALMPAASKALVAASRICALVLPKLCDKGFTQHGVGWRE
ncbi:hypothetical protein NDK47_13105 [Brevibacillus ruminantium]|uniref:Uncharacterized protein n=1 Tax=Brevibacillus ruminantium TaxID=2950604 RepID=A0ABY4WLW4_9BACL|nr:hypothetical protein [Brevibacillus ruminantium]USG68158.1 hypothetical protein NDK47_13105 [Brevibacillus ruminantium]